MAGSKVLRILLLAISLLLCDRAAFASVDLHPALCIAGRADERAQVAGGAYRIPSCADPSAPTNWVVLRLGSTARLADLSAGWRLMVDQNRFSQIVVTVRSRAGSVQRIVHDENSIGADWAPGDALAFPIRFAGRDVTGLTIAFRDLDGPMFIRKVVAMEAPAERLRSDRWLLLIGLFVGAVISALIYNVVIYVGQRERFQRWYVVWACSVLCYGAWWTGLLGFVSDLLVGPRAVRAAGLCLGFVIASGAMFLIELLEPGTIGRSLLRAGRAIAAATLLAALVAAADWLVPPVPADHVLNAVLIGNTLWVLATVITAARRGSKVVWFYLAGWLPVLSMFVLRVARNLGWLPQSDLVDMATFAAIALEAIILSVTISYRFRHLRRERDAAESAIAAMAVEAEVLRHAAQTDHLTKLGNRSAFHTVLQTLGRQSSLFLIDVDHLKEINDSFGHQHGDALLVHIATRLRETNSADALIARIGGDEFAIALPVNHETTVAEAIDSLQGEQWTYGGRSHSLSLSIGHARSGCEGIAPAQLYQQADFALYQAKRLGRGRRHRYDPAIARLLDLETSLAADASHALANDEFILHYQPIVALGDRQQIGAEALLRWEHPVRGLLTPQAFGSLLADEALGPLIQDRVLSIAIEQMATAADERLYLSVNFTGAQLRGKAAAFHILDRLKRANVPTDRLCVEVTEGVFLDRKGDEIAEALNALHSAGVRIALDDFGTGYASLVHLQRIPVDILKIDRSFVSGLDQADQQTREIVRSILSLSHALRKEVIAEGIETEAQHRRLLDFGCRLGQGFLFAEPSPIAYSPTAEDRSAAA